MCSIRSDIVSLLFDWGDNNPDAGGGECQEETTWLNVLAFGGLAKTLERLGRGDQVAIAGRLKNRTDQDGKITGLEIIADRVDFLRLKDDQAKAA